MALQSIADGGMEKKAAVKTLRRLLTPKGPGYYVSDKLRHLVTLDEAKRADDIAAKYGFSSAIHPAARHHLGVLSEDGAFLNSIVAKLAAGRVAKSFLKTRTDMDTLKQLRRQVKTKFDDVAAQRFNSSEAANYDPRLLNRSVFAKDFVNELNWL